MGPGCWLRSRRNPWDIPRIAASAGFSASGMWVDPKKSWDKAALGKTKLSLKETEYSLLMSRPLGLRNQIEQMTTTSGLLKRP